MWTNSPFLNSAIDGDDGGKGCIMPRASFTASTSLPAKTVIIRVGFTADFATAIAAGRADPAAHPQTEFTTTNVVPSAIDC